MAKITNGFNKFFVDTGTELAIKIPTAKIAIEIYVETVNSTM